MIDRPFLRIGDAERDRAASALQRSVAEGRLTTVELPERLARASAARTRGELAAVLADVLPPSHLEELVTGDVPRLGLGPGYAWDDPLVIIGRWQDEKRLGVWDVPPFLEVHSVAGNVKLNFTQARPVSLVIDVVNHGGAGNTVLVIPTDWGVDTSRVVKGLGSLKCYVDPRPHPGSPQIVVRGNTKLGNLVVRYPNRFDSWQQSRAVRRLTRPALGS